MNPEQAEILRRIEVLEICLQRIVKGLTTQRAATIMLLDAQEYSLGWERTIKPKDERQAAK